MLVFIRERQMQGEWILLVGDMNEVIGVTDRGMSKLHHECDLVEACLEKHGVTEFTTYQRGTWVIDYVLVDRSVIHCIQSIGYEPFNLRILSDHRGVFIDLKTSQCFGSNILPLQPIQLGGMSTKQSHQIAPYFNAKQKHLGNHK